MKEMKTLTIGGNTYEIVDDKARKDIATVDAASKRDCVAPITNTIDGSSIVIADSSNRPIRNLRLFGKTDHVITTGAQLLDFSTMKMDSGGTTVSSILNSGRHVTITGTKAYAMGYIDIDVTPYVGKTLYLTGTKSGGNSPSLTARLIKKDGSKTYAPSITTGYTVLADDATISIQFIANNTASTLTSKVTATFTDVMVSPMADASWEPYTGGIPGPSPLYPQTPHNVINPTVTVKGGNLIPVSYADGKSKTMNGVTFEVQPDGSVIVNGTATATAHFSFNTTSNKIRMPEGWLSVSSGIKCGPGVPHVQNDIYVDGVYINAVQTATEIATKRYFTGKVELGASRVKVDAGVTVVSQRIYPMLCACENPIAYEPPKQPQVLTINRTLPGIGDVYDEVDFERGVYIKRVNTRTFDGSEGWIIGEQNAAEGYLGVLYTANNDALANCTALCSHYKQGESVGVFDMVGHFDTYYSQFRINLGDFTTVEEWKAQLAAWEAEGKPLTLVYQLATPIETKLTEEELAAFDTLYTNKTNTTILNDCGAMMEVEYAVDIETYVQNNSGKPTDEQIAKAINEYLEENPLPDNSTDLTGYATEEWVGENYQPKGEYLTAVPDGYATEEWVGENYQPKGEYLTAVPSGYATEQFVQDKISEAQLSGGEGGNDVDLTGYATEQFVRDRIAEAQLSGGSGGSVDLGNYALKTEIPTKVSTLENDAEYLSETSLSSAINTALAQAKESGAFDGEAGATPQKGVDYFTEADKSEFVNSVLAALPVWTGGSY